MTVTFAILIGVAIFAFLTNITFFGTVIYIAKIFSNVIAWTIVALIGLGVFKTFKCSRKAVNHAGADQSPN
jgi:hypothetical protein